MHNPVIWGYDDQIPEIFGNKEILEMEQSTGFKHEKEEKYRNQYRVPFP